MRITRVTIENFRSIQVLDLEPTQLLGLVGANNAGKSNILAALKRVLAPSFLRVSDFSDEDIHGRNPDVEICIKVSVDPPIPYYKFKGSEPTLIGSLAFTYTRYKSGSQKGLPRLEQACFDPKGNAALVLREAPKKGKQHQYQPLIGIPPEVREGIPLIFIGTDRSLKNQLPSARYSLLRQLLEDVNRDFHDPNQTVEIEGPDGTPSQMPRSHRFADLMQQVMMLLRTPAFDALEKSIKTNALRQLGFDPKTEGDRFDFYFSPFDTIDFYKALDLRVRESGFDLSATELGEGFQNAIVVAILQAFEERRKQGAIMLIEEPEMYLHPQMQRSLYRTLRTIGQSNQVIYTTHSPHFVSVPEYQEVALIRKGPAGTTATRSALPSDPRLREKLIKELDPERNELFFASRLLLVEGDTEKLALPEYARRLNLDLDKAGATIVEVGGKRNLKEFARISSSFGIPTGILYDIDSSDIDDSNEQKLLNKELDALAKSDGSVVVWQLSKNYEDNLRRALTEKVYQEYCMKFPKTGKPTRARLIALDSGSSIPSPIPEILDWLVKR